MSNPGWRSRGYLPHLDVPGLLRFITFRLGDSVPEGVLKEILAATEPGDPLRLPRIERWLDLGRGACWLRRPDIGAVVEGALLHFDGPRDRQLAWVVMPNHVHCLIETCDGHPLDRVLQACKSFTAKEANRLLDRHGTFWDRDDFDRYIRDDAHRAAVVRYIERNPVKAGLVVRPEDWPFGSARLRTTGADPSK